MSTYTYDNRCGSCGYFNMNDRDNFKYKCTRRGFRVGAEESKCGYYTYDSTRDYDELHRIDNPSGCYITTIMCEILGLPDNSEILETLRAFRDNVLQKNPKYYLILLQYDIYGPLISINLKNDSNKVNICRDLVKRYFAPIKVFIDDNHYDEAITFYARMVNELKARYGIITNSQKENIPDYNQELGGHGYVRK